MGMKYQKQGPSRPLPSNPLEVDRQAEIIDYLRNDPRVLVVMRINGGGRKIKGFWVWFYRLFIHGVDPMDGKGCLDLLIMLQGGIMGALEVKRPKEKLSDEQKQFSAAVAAGGGLSARIETWMDAKTAIDEFLSNRRDMIQASVSCENLEVVNE